MPCRAAALAWRLQEPLGHGEVPPCVFFLLKADSLQAVGCFAHRQGPGPVPFIMRDGDSEHLAMCVLEAQVHPQGAIPVTSQEGSHFKGVHWQIAGYSSAIQ